ncbi:MAG: putative fatty-acid--CoA ligase [Acidimicrobiales bacterium]|jgi:fatty-acyl-CoA synthase|nr:putative fatty-acid--CoA ligase [Acidimicrobiales bacterium]
MTTLVDRIERAAERPGTVTFIRGDQAEPVSWAQLHDDAVAMAARLQGRGIGKGSHVALLGPTSRPLVTAIQATWLAGATVIVLPLPMRLGSVDEFVGQTRARIRNADASLVVIDPDLAAFVEPRPGDPPMLALDALVSGPHGSYDRPAVRPEDLAILQFTSGSTADPKGVMLPHDRVIANLDAAGRATQIDADTDVAVSWLPLYHDMGMIGLLTIPMITGTDLVLAGPQDFMAAPARWLEWLSAFGGTITAGPNFSYALAARALRSRPAGVDLSRWRIGLNGAEPVDPATVEAFCQAGAPFGLHPGAVFCAFGMAEVTIAGTFPEPGKGMAVDAVERRVLETDRYAAPADPYADTTRRFARLGRPVPGLAIRISEPGTGRAMGEREVGELEIQGTSVTPGYYKHPEATAAAFRDGGWLRTGDLAYIVDGELVVCGRIKDVIIVGGRNVFPEDVERAVADIDGVRAGNVIAFGVEGRRGREGVVVVCETKADDSGPVRDAVAKRVRQAVGIPPHEVVLVGAGALPKTSSGKLQRSLCRDRYLNAELTVD